MLYFKTTDLYTLDTKIWKNILHSYESKKNTWICRQLKYCRLRIRRQIVVSLEIIVNAFKRLTVSLSTEILILAIAPFSFILIGSFCELAVLPDMYILLSAQEKKVPTSSWGDRHTHLEAHSSKAFEPFTCHYFSMPR